MELPQARETKRLPQNKSLETDQKARFTRSLPAQLGRSAHHMVHEYRLGSDE